MVVRIGVEDAEERHGDVHAVEQVDVVLAAGAGTGTSHKVLGVHDAGDQLLQVAVVLRQRQLANLLAGQAALQGRRFLVDESGRGRDGDVLRHALHCQLGVRRCVLSEEYGRLPRGRLHSGEGVRDRVVARDQLR